MYIVQLSSKGLVHLEDGQITLTADPNKASHYNTIGDAIRSAVKVNEALGSNLARAVEYNIK